MPSVTVTKKIARPRSQVFAFVSDCRNDPKWAPMVPEVEQVSGDGPGKGARYRIKQGIGGGKYRWMEMETTVFDESKELGWGMVTHEMTYRSSMIFTEIAGGTRVRQTNTIKFGSTIRGIVWKLLANVVLRRQLRRLRRVIEAAPNE